MIDALQEQSNEINRKIDSLNAKLNLAAAVEGEGSFSTNPPTVPDGFTQVTIIHNSTKHHESTHEKTDVTYSTKTTGFWIFKKKQRSVTTTSSFDSLCEDEGTEIRIGMNIAKVTIEREWFNPGVFALTDEMYNTVLTNSGSETLKISHGPDGSQSELDSDVFPCYPTALIIARDVTIKITKTSSSSSSSVTSASTEASKSRGFFVFNAGNSSSSSSKDTETSTMSDDKSITMRFSTPQIIGICQHYLPKDQSVKYPSNDSGNDTIIAFVNAYKELIDAKIKAQA